MAKYKSRFQGQVIDATLQAVIDGKAGIQGVKIDTIEITPNSENKVNISTSELNIPEVVQEPRQSTSKVMSQNSVSSLLSQKANLNDLSTVAYSGSYIDLSNKPNIPTKTSDLANDSNFVSNSDLSESYYNKSQTDNLLSSKSNTNDLSTVATSGQYSDLSGLPSIPSKTSDLTNNSNFVSSSNLATVATNGSYNDLLDKPSIPSVIPSVVQTTGSSTTDVMSQNAVTNAIPTIRTSYAVGSSNSAYSIDYINGLSCFSTSERHLGSWIDGSAPLYTVKQFNS